MESTEISGGGGVGEWAERTRWYGEPCNRGNPKIDYGVCLYFDWTRYNGLWILLNFLFLWIVLYLVLLTSVLFV